MDENKENVGAPTVSPAPNKGLSIMPKPILMEFPEAIRAVIDGKKVRRLDWGEAKDYCKMGETYLSIYRESDNKLHEWLVNDGDINAFDWVIVPESN